MGMESVLKSSLGLIMMASLPQVMRPLVKLAIVLRLDWREEESDSPPREGCERSGAGW